DIFLCLSHGVRHARQFLESVDGVLRSARGVPVRLRTSADGAPAGEQTAAFCRQGQFLAVSVPPAGDVLHGSRADGRGADTGVGGGSVVLSFVVAWGTYNLIEAPARRVIVALWKDRPRTAKPVSASVTAVIEPVKQISA